MVCLCARLKKGGCWARVSRTGKNGPTNGAEAPVQREKMQDKRIEILMATYNGAPYLCEQIDSILRQTDRGWHLTISDDGSTDGTDAIIDGYVQRYPDRICRVASGRRFGGAMLHFLWLTQQCNADYMAFCDQDDVWYDGKLEALRRSMLDAEARLGGQTPVLVFSDQTVTDEKLRTLSPSLMRYQKQYFERFDYRSILIQNVVTGGAMMINRALAELALQCADTSQVVMHDWWMAAVAARFGEIVYIDEPLGAYRQHGNNSVGAKDVGSLRHILYMLGHTQRIRQTLACKKAQASVFERTYASRLGEADHLFLERFARRRSGLAFYLRHRMLIHGGLRLAGMVAFG